MQEHRFFSFGSYQLDMHNEQLWHGEELIRLTYKALRVLGYLVERCGQLVTKDELFAVLWPEVMVSESALVVCVRDLRRALGDARQAPYFIETVHGRGYRFVAPVHETMVLTHRPRVDPLVFSSPRLSPFVGREAELAYLHRMFEKILQGERQMVFITGEAGIGKTALINQFLTQLSGNAHIWSARGQCVEFYGAGEPYLPLLDALGRLCRGADGAHLIEWLRRHAPTWLLYMPALLSADDLTTLQRRGAGSTRARMLRELAEALDVLTYDCPLILILEDLLWSDAATVEWLGAVARRPEPAKLLLIGTHRPIEMIMRGHPLRRLQQELLVHGLCEELPLRYLTEDALTVYLSQRFCLAAQDETLCYSLARLVYHRTEGNPLFMVNVVNDWVRQEMLREEAGQWQLCGGLDALSLGVPDTLRQLINLQIEQLETEVQALLEAASVAGVRFTAAAVAVGMEVKVDVIEAHCDLLVQREQFVRARGMDIWPDGTSVALFEFRHVLYQEVLYHRLSVSRRMRLHQRITKWLAQRGETQAIQRHPTPALKIR